LKDILTAPNLDLLHQFARSNTMLAFDYDGTLAPIVADARDARMRPRTLSLFDRLAERYPCVVISGRARNDVAERLGSAPVAEVIGNHGLEPWQRMEEFAAQARAWVPTLRKGLANLDGIEVEDKVFSVAVHYRRAPEQDRARQAILDVATRLPPLRVVGGKMVVNLIPVGAPNKGNALIAARDRLGCTSAIYVGDDETDEDVFAIDEREWLLTIRIGATSDSRAAFFLPDQEAVDWLIEELLRARSPGEIDRPSRSILEARPQALESAVLVGDIGGTNSRLALLTPNAGPTRPIRAATLPTRQYSSVEELAAAFLGPSPPVLAGAVFAVAGPVVGGRVELTNVGWTLDEKTLAARFGGSVRLLNDLVAMAYSIPHLGPDGIQTLQTGEPNEHGAIGLVAPGTGLGEAFLVWDGARYRPQPSEGGHADFAPTDGLQRELLAWLSARHDHVSYERVCSGRGLPNLYSFLRERSVAPETAEVAARLTAVNDPTPVIIEAALARPRPCPLSLATVELFTSILAAEAGNAALRVMATGGVYLGGGLPRRLVSVLAEPAFARRFCAKGRLSAVLSRVPLHVIPEPGAALLGAGHYALGMSRDGSP